MPPKRKQHSSAFSRPAKKRAHARPSSEEYRLKNILKESETHYLIDWEGEDEQGKPYKPTWEPKGNANKLAVADWESKKNSGTETTAAGASKGAAVPVQGPKQGSTRRRKAAREYLKKESPPRKRSRYSEPVIDGFPPPPPPPSSSLKPLDGPNHGQEPEAATQELEIRESDPEDESDIPSTAARRIAARVQRVEPEDESDLPITTSQRIAVGVQLSDPPSSYEAGVYEKITIARSSRPSPQGETPENLSEVADNSSKLLQSTADEGSQTGPVLASTPSTVDKDTSLCVPESQDQEQSQSSSFEAPSLDARSNPKTNEQEEAAAVVEDEPAGDSLHEALVSEASQHSGVASAPLLESRSRSSESVRDTAPEHQLKASQITINTGDQQEASAGSRSQTGSTAQAEDDQVFAGAQSEVRSVIGSVQQCTYQTPDLGAEQLSHSTAEDLPLKRTIVGEQGETPADSTPEALSTTDNPRLREEPGSTHAPPDSFDQSQYTKEVRPAHEGHFIVVSSEDDHIQPSTDETSNQSHEFLSQAQYELPPGAQRPLPSTVLNEEDLVKVSQLEHPPTNCSPRANADSLLQSVGPSQSPFPFQTQLEAAADVTFRKIEPRVPTTPVPRTAEFAASARVSSRPSSERSDRSTPFPSIPEFTIGTVGASAPAHLQTPSPMDSSMPPRVGSVGMKARLKEHRERHRSTRQTPISEQPVPSLPPVINAEVQAARIASPVLSLADSVRSPSAVPAIEPVTQITREEQNTSERCKTLLPGAQGISSDSDGDAHDGTLTNTGAHLAGAATMASHEPNEDPEIANMHVVPIPLLRHQQDLYVTNIRWHEELISRFLTDRQPSPELLTEVEMLLERLRNIATHPDLVNIESLTQASECGRQAQWDIDSSAKFDFLKVLFDGLQSTAPLTHVAVAACGSRLPDMLETFCKGWQFSYSRGSSGSTSHFGKEGLNVTILDLDVESEPPRRADIVIAMDGATDYRHRLIRAARRRSQTAPTADTNAWAMMLTLVVPRTIEHIQRCIEADLPRLVQLRVLLRQVQKWKPEAGKKELGSKQADSKGAAMQVTNFWDSPEASKWPLGSISQIQDLDSQTQTELSELEASRVQSLAVAKDLDGDKRDLEDSDLSMSSSHPTKRPRTSPERPTTMDPQELDATHISDSVDKQTQPSLDEIFAPSPSVREKQLREELTRVQGQLEEHVKDIEALQYRNEEQRTELVHVKREKEDALTRAQMAIQRMTLAENSNSSLKKDCTALKHELEGVRRKLLDHSVPDRAEFEMLRQTAEQAEREREKVNTRLEVANRDVEWHRVKSQDDYNDKRDLIRENQDLQARLSIAEKQAAGEAARARQISQQAHYQALERENKKLRAIVKERDAGLKFRDEEITRLKESTRGRIGTRQTSVPRSPRLGSPMKGGRGSRQASPAAGEPRGRTSNLHVVRNSG